MDYTPFYVLVIIFCNFLGVIVTNTIATTTGLHHVICCEGNKVEREDAVLLVGFFIGGILALAGLLASSTSTEGRYAFVNYLAVATLLQGTLYLVLYIVLQQYRPIEKTKEELQQQDAL